MPSDNSKVRVELTEEQQRQSHESESGEDIEFHAEELEERIAPAQAPLLPDAVV